MQIKMEQIQYFIVTFLKLINKKDEWREKRISF